jgi:hypothetical protein
VGTVKVVAGVPLKLIVPVARSRFVPVKVTTWPGAAELGVMAVSVGGGE